jgi:hypothetical protein
MSDWHVGSYDAKQALENIRSTVTRIENQLWINSLNWMPAFGIGVGIGMIISAVFVRYVV